MYALIADVYVVPQRTHRAQRVRLAGEPGESVEETPRNHVLAGDSRIEIDIEIVIGGIRRHGSDDYVVELNLHVLDA